MIRLIFVIALIFAGSLSFILSSVFFGVPEFRSTGYSAGGDSNRQNEPTHIEHTTAYRLLHSWVLGAGCWVFWSCSRAVSMSNYFFISSFLHFFIVLALVLARKTKYRAKKSRTTAGNGFGFSTSTNNCQMISKTPGSNSL
jgi:hypothetical protein